MPEIDSQPLLGDCLCLDFVNTLERRPGGRGGREGLTDYDALLAWARRAGAIDSELAGWLDACAAWAPGVAADALGRARELREAIHAVAAPFAAGETPEADGLDRLNRALSGLLARTGLAAGGTGLARAWTGEADAPERLLWPLAWSAFDLFAGPEFARLRVCAGADCHRLFLDRSKNRSRRWCAMESCGNVAKARRHRARTRAA